MNDLRNSPHFCILPWLHLQLRQDGSVHPCCRMNASFSYGSRRTHSLTEIWNSDSAKLLRKTLLNGESFSGCADCRRSEAKGDPSLRQEANAYFKDQMHLVNKTASDGHLHSSEILYLDLRFSNLCNFKCRSCGPESSSRWAADSTNSSPILRAFANQSEMWEILDPLLPTLKRIYFAGGEPLLSEEHYLLLNKLIELGRTDVVLVYNTNFSKLSLRDQHCLQLWQNFKEVHINASLDGVGAFGEALRKGLSWPDFIRNYQRLRLLCPEVQFSIYYTVSAMNAFHLPTAVNELLKLGMIRGPGYFQLNFVSEPASLSLDVLSQIDRHKLSQLYKDFLTEVQKDVGPQMMNSLTAILNSVLRALNGPVREDLRSQFHHLMQDINPSSF